MRELLGDVVFVKRQRRAHRWCRKVNTPAYAKALAQAFLYDDGVGGESDCGS